MIKGENALIKRRLKDANNVDLPIASLVSAKCRLNGIEYVYGTNAELRQGAVSNELEFEITKEISATLPKSTLTIEFELEVPNADFDVDLNQVDIFRVFLKVE